MGSSGAVPAIELAAVTKFYGRSLGIEEVSFDVAYGQTLGLLGPNGAGKTTAIRVILGLIRATSGRAMIAGQDVGSGGPAMQADVGYLPGTLALYEHMTGLGFLHYLARLRQRDCEVRVNELADRFDIDLSRRIHDLSRGNKQKIGVVQAFMHNPRVIILDEPTSGLDPIMQHEFEALVGEVRDEGCAVLLSSHVMSEVEALADRVAILDHGRLVTCQTIQELRAKAVRRLELEFAQEVSPQDFLGLSAITRIEAHGTTLSCQVVGDETEVLRVAVEHGLRSVRTEEPSLEEAFLALVDDRNTDVSTRG
ncbi:MAG: ABC transporter ATP-binding protein [Candidatus Nanopelagicales bacterium]